jgi:hypothetical protein
MSVISSAGANYTSQLTRFPPIAGSVGNIYTPTLINNTAVPSGTNTIMISSVLVEGTYTIQGFIEYFVNTGITISSASVQIQSANSAGDLQTIVTFASPIEGSNSNFYVPVNWTFYSVPTATPNFTLAVDAVTSDGSTYNVASGTLTIAKIA